MVKLIKNLVRKVIPKRRLKVQLIHSHKYWRLVGANGEILAHSEIYSTNQKALQTALIVADSGGFRYEVLNFEK
jgi:uncharacterized protein YegP (UPF0339 family)